MLEKPTAYQKMAFVEGTILVVSLAREQDERLNGRLSSSQNLYDKLESLMEWLTALKQDLTNKDYSVDSPSDLQVKCKKFKVSYPRLSITIQCCL